MVGVGPVAKAWISCSGSCGGPGCWCAFLQLQGLPTACTKQWRLVARVGQEACRCTAGGLAVSACCGAGYQLEVGLNPDPQAAVGPCLSVCTSMAARSHHGHAHSSRGWSRESDLWHASTQLDGLAPSAHMVVWVICECLGYTLHSCTCRGVHSYSDHWFLQW